jgi:uncharacterized protein YndB with AHSA1/START domain
MTSSARQGDRILGTLRSADGAGVVRMERRFDTDIDDLWSALTEPRRIARWYGEVAGDLQLGGEFHARVYASGWEGTGRVEVCEPPRRFLVVSKDPDEPHEDIVEVNLSAEGDQTIFVVEQSGLPLELLAAYGAGLQIHVEDLADHIAGGQRRDAEARWGELLPAYRDMAAGVS